VVKPHSIVDAAPGEAILQVAHEEGIGQLVMATHGRGGLARVVVGCVAPTVLRRADIPIVLINPQSTDRQRKLEAMKSAASAREHVVHVS